MSTTDTSPTFADPYQAAPTDSQPAWLDGAAAVTQDASAAAAQASASAPSAAFQDPYQAAPTDAHPAWLGGPQAVTQDMSASGAAAADAPAQATQAADSAAHTVAGWFDGALPVQGWINDGLSWFVDHFRPAFQALRQPVDALLGGVEAALLYPPTLVMIGLLSLLAWQLAGARMAIFTGLSLLVIGLLGIWNEAMVTLSLVLTALSFCVLIGVPLGIWLARSERANRLVRPLLDAMQTTPAFVYLVPVVMLFGIGNVPGVIVTIIFALAPLVRLTNLGIRQVRPDLVEAATAYGASPWQLLTKVQLPLAMPSIMAGINQALMLSLSMVVIASMIAVGGLGLMVLRGIGRLDMGLASVGGLGIVILAIVLDRLTQALSQPQRHGQSWATRGPIGLVRRALARRPASAAADTAAPNAHPQAQPA
ncbi:glycine betaine/L-proline ABC transporter permease ProW [Ottowia sp. GY511]|uniref:Glycine betaine/L-proline ABC transporter permease ProW n=1 Tax=Ottowia flava TaxID=2675430 RepID=A0ABW4KX92_9BURK|nr:glycine betaine/L-proline ABC transporter permease ProW [Ottowia sp. GY511]TXK27308.1 glycine betaine/L-proline ABC transporter permease ProW [Ottowia sp. GY511]